MGLILIFISSFFVNLSFSQDATPSGNIDVNRIDLAVKKSLIDNPVNYPIPQPGYGAENINKLKFSEWLRRIYNKLLNYLQKVGDWINRRIGNNFLIPEVKGLTKINRIVEILIIIIILFFFYNIIPLLKFKRKSQEEFEPDENTITISLEKALSRAEKEAKEGNYTNALRELLRGFYMGLSEKGFIQYKLSRTNREYRRLIPRVAPSYSELACDFLPYMDDVLYGGIETDNQHYLKYKTEIVKAFKN